MIDKELARLRARIEKMDARSGTLKLNPCATRAQVESFEEALGLPLPDDYREFLLHFGDGLRVGESEELWMSALFPDNVTASIGGTPLVAFPIEHVPVDPCIHAPRLWEELSADEQTEKEVALYLVSTRTWDYSCLVLSGEHRGTVWMTSAFCCPAQQVGASFLEGFERLLDEVAYARALNFSSCLNPFASLRRIVKPSSLIRPLSSLRWRASPANLTGDCAADTAPA